MAVDDSRGECSRKCDSTTTEDEKPLKKARYVWEVKGKYHLKDRKENDPVSSSSSPIQETNNNSTSETNQCCIASFLKKTEAIMDDVDESEDIVASTSSNNNADGVEVPVSMVSALAKNQDYYLSKWQARQIARGFVDNTINRVLETWTNPPFDAVDFVDNCDNDGQVEDEGILMAIQSHGLRGTSIPSSSSSQNPTDMQSVSLMAAEGIEQSALDNFENYQSELTKEQSPSEPSPSSSSNENLSCDSTSITNDALEMENPIDFLNAAVSVAIQKKGLSYGY